MVRMCSRKWSLRLVLCVHSGQMWGFSPVCVLRWWLRCWRRFLPWKTLQHTGHLRGGVVMVWKENTATPQDIVFLVRTTPLPITKMATNETTSPTLLLPRPAPHTGRTFTPHATAATRLRGQTTIRGRDHSTPGGYK